MRADFPASPLFTVLAILMLAPLTFFTLYSGAILAGWHKGPLLAHFRAYGEESKDSPLATFLFFLGAVLLLLAFLWKGSAMGYAVIGLAFLLSGRRIKRGDSLSDTQLPTALIVLGALMLVIGFLEAPVELLWALWAILALIGSVLVPRLPLVQTFLPRWYDRFLRETNRRERRAIAIAWARLPARARRRYNGDGHAFRIFVDEVRLTVIYGAREWRNDGDWV